MHLAALRIDAGEDVLDGAVLARRIHRLEDAQHRPAILRVEHVLQLREALDTLLEQVGRMVLFDVEAAGIGRVEVLQAEALAGGDAETVQDFRNAFFDHAAFPLGASTIHSAAPACNRNVTASAAA